MKHLINRILSKYFGVYLTRSYNFDTDWKLSAWEKLILFDCIPRTKTNINSLQNLLLAGLYIDQNKIPGAFVECGVWRGGSALAFAKSAVERGASSRSIYLFDTFSGYDKTDLQLDFQISDGESAQNLFIQNSEYLCEASLSDVQEGLESSGYPKSNIHYIAGDVLETLPRFNSPEIAILRLDTDYYESTRIELEYLFPYVAKGGVVIIDDYDYWNGSKQAVDEYLASQALRPLLVRMESGRIFVKE